MTISDIRQLEFGALKKCAHCPGPAAYARCRTQHCTDRENQPTPRRVRRTADICHRGLGNAPSKCAAREDGYPYGNHQQAHQDSRPRRSTAHLPCHPGVQWPNSARFPTARPIPSSW
jgi:hypothetical protein